MEDVRSEGNKIEGSYVDPKEVVLCDEQGCNQQSFSEEQDGDQDEIPLCSSFALVGFIEQRLAALTKLHFSRATRLTQIFDNVDDQYSAGKRDHEERDDV